MCRPTITSTRNTLLHLLPSLDHTSHLKTSHQPSVNTHRRLIQQVQITYNCDPVDQDNHLLDTSQQPFRDGDDGDSGLDESSRNLNNILGQKSQIWHYTTYLYLFLHGSIEGSNIPCICHRQLQVMAKWRLRQWRWWCCQCWWWWWSWWWWWWWWRWEWVDTWRYGN